MKKIIISFTIILAGLASCDIDASAGEALAVFKQYRLLGTAQKRGHEADGNSFDDDSGSGEPACKVRIGGDRLPMTGEDQGDSIKSPATPIKNILDSFLFEEQETQVKTQVGPVQDPGTQARPFGQPVGLDVSVRSSTPSPEEQKQALVNKAVPSFGDTYCDKVVKGSVLDNSPFKPTSEENKKIVEEFKEIANFDTPKRDKQGQDDGSGKQQALNLLKKSEKCTPGRTRQKMEKELLSKFLHRCMEKAGKNPNIDWPKSEYDIKTFEQYNIWLDYMINGDMSSGKGNPTVGAPKYVQFLKKKTSKFLSCLAYNLYHIVEGELEKNEDGKLLSIKGAHTVQSMKNIIQKYPDNTIIIAECPENEVLFYQIGTPENDKQKWFNKNVFPEHLNTKEDILSLLYDIENSDSYKVSSVNNNDANYVQIFNRDCRFYKGAIFVGCLCRDGKKHKAFYNQTVYPSVYLKTEDIQGRNDIQLLRFKKLDEHQAIVNDEELAQCAVTVSYDELSVWMIDNKDKTRKTGSDDTVDVMKKRIVGGVKYGDISSFLGGKVHGMKRRLGIEKKVYSPVKEMWVEMPKQEQTGAAAAALDGTVLFTGE